MKKGKYTEEQIIEKSAYVRCEPYLFLMRSGSRYRMISSMTSIMGSRAWVSFRDGRG